MLLNDFPHMPDVRNAQSPCSNSGWQDKNVVRMDDIRLESSEGRSKREDRDARRPYVREDLDRMEVLAVKNSKGSDCDFDTVIGQRADKRPLFRDHDDWHELLGKGSDQVQERVLSTISTG
jgi:hypothetical protein